jgi:DNA-binding transcriptional LysR family regulator
LFARSRRGYSLTNAGEQLLEHVLTMEQQSIAVQRKAIAQDDSLRGCVRVATVDDLAVSVLAPIIHEFRRKHPAVAVDIDVRASFRDLTRNEADVAIRFGRKPDDDDVIAKHVARTDAALYASPAYLDRHGRPTCLDALFDHQIVCCYAHAADLHIQKVVECHADPAKVALRSNSFLVRRAAIRDGMGIGWLGCWMADQDDQLERLDFRFPESTTQLWLLIHKELRQSARVRAFVDHTYAALVAQRHLFEGSKGRAANSATQPAVTAS